MNHNYVNLNASFLRQEWKQIFLLKFGSILFLTRFNQKYVASKYTTHFLWWNYALCLYYGVDFFKWPQYQKHKTFPQGSLSSLTKLRWKRRFMSYLWQLRTETLARKTFWAPEAYRFWTSNLVIRTFEEYVKQYSN